LESASLASSEYGSISSAMMARSLLLWVGEEYSLVLKSNGIDDGIDDTSCVHVGNETRLVERKSVDDREAKYLE